MRKKGEARNRREEEGQGEMVVGGEERGDKRRGEGLVASS